MTRITETESHPLSPFLPPEATVLMLGSFPPKRERWSMDFYYPNLQNDMWRIFGVVFFGDKDHFIVPATKKFDPGRIQDFLNDKGIALSDTALRVVRHRDNASDNFLEIVEPADVGAMIRAIPRCTAIVTTGEKAAATLSAMFDIPMPKVGECIGFMFEGRRIRHCRMPSSSRAYPKPLADKAEAYRKVFAGAGILR